MSKKKATMTLKDFHGGSIPSDLPLPSAPGVSVRPVDRGGFDRQLSWGNSAGRSDHRLRPSSAGSVRNHDEKTHFLNHSPHIGRNFDEDERKPLDGISGPRRTISDETSRAQTSLVTEPKIENQSGARVGGRTASIPVSQMSSGSTGSSYAGRVSEVHNARLNTQTSSGSRGYGSNYPIMGGNAGQAVTGSYPNAWGIRKETAGMKEQVSVVWSAPEAEMKLANASALEKVGRYSKHVHPLKDAEISGHPKTEGQFEYNANNIYNKKTNNRLDVIGDSDHHDVALKRHVERSLVLDDGIRGGEFQSVLPSESSERPKLKLLPRSKPVENLETSIDNKQGYERTSDHLHAEDGYIVHEPKNPMQSDVSGPVVSDRAPERPKLNLKPRSQPLEQLKGKSEVKSKTVFGGARPRELVLKERGVDDEVSNYESQPPLRAKEGSPKADTFTNVTPVRHGEKAESIITDQRTMKYSDKRDHQMDGERIDSHRKNRQNEVWRNSDKQRNQQQQKQVQERAPSPETWRKPVEHPASSDAPPIRYGKAASAVELAHTFSKSVSNPTVDDQFSGLRGIPSRSQIPFSRLTTGSSPRPHINGY